MRFVIFVLCSITWVSGKRPSDIVSDPVQAKQGYEYLLEVRSTPVNYYKELGYAKNIKVSGIKLIWNDTLAQVATAKAMDMAKRNYFAHVDPDGFGMNYYINKAGYKLNADWLSKKSMNYFESLVAGDYNGVDAIKTLLIDAQTPGLGHRIHLLGLNEWNGSLKDIGIGYVRSETGSTYKTYVCVLIAKHDW